MSLQNTPVTPNEMLARFVFQSKHFRSSDNTVKPECFMPHPHQDMSVTRHRDIDESELWKLGSNAAAERSRKSGTQITMYGRADISAKDIFDTDLNIEPSEPPKNHANIKPFPSEKAKQKQISQLLALKAHLVYFPK
ncbi:MAG TPA: hypothetical protein PK624_06900 [Spirochaetota bacterium]|nr:hypothetical protein [Spirochaetota bacterium]HOR44506.1 hypothetical protein [Spirochaetota bacterium]